MNIDDVYYNRITYSWRGWDVLFWKLSIKHIVISVCTFILLTVVYTQTFILHISEHICLIGIWFTINLDTHSQRIRFTIVTPKLCTIIQQWYDERSYDYTVTLNAETTGIRQFICESVCTSNRSKHSLFSGCQSIY